MADQNRNTVAGFLEAMTLLGEHMPEKLQTKFFLSAEHDIICAHVDSEMLPEDSPAGQRLQELGWFYDGEGWARNV